MGKHHSGLDFEGAALGKFDLASRGLAEDVLAVVASNRGLRVAEDCGGLVAAAALDVHKVGVGGRNEPLQLVLLLLGLVSGVQKVSLHE